MAVPSKKMSKTRSRRRRAMWRKRQVEKLRNKLQFATCSESVRGVRLRHRVSPDTGMYRGDHVVQVKQKTDTVLEA